MIIIEGEKVCLFTYEPQNWKENVIKKADFLHFFAWATRMFYNTLSQLVDDPMAGNALVHVVKLTEGGFRSRIDSQTQRRK